ncbi:pseudouridylate synthases 23S rRNA-specific [Candidatus Brocadia sinica JPN1]|uniref:Pseudouridylate synthases 23S rRNA-specific n=1 Tax=Candidatus Brocadia sinica JPN1 TaxID=1197129 RepID=A0ABQ0K1U0_9BACT|nr:hypothetical protein [Candidatus Brocadia sp. AMX2]NUO06205.1 hypothetical protein [Candidatus Brocadia sinica]GAN34908.1 pseudouridylate synthases 23S rRNA-specific [Candidatus Brocadia sinica JPN1]
MGMAKGAKCESEICKLKDKSLSFLKRIKAHCLDCVGTRQEVKSCTGKLLFEDRLCYLHPYRFGHNPRQRGIGNPRFAKKPQRNDMFSGVKNVSELTGSGLGR